MRIREVRERFPHLYQVVYGVEEVSFPGTRARHLDDVMVEAVGEVVG